MHVEVHCLFSLLFVLRAVTRAINNLVAPDSLINDAVDVRQELDLRIGISVSVAICFSFSFRALLAMY